MKKVRIFDSATQPHRPNRLKIAVGATIVSAMLLLPHLVQAAPIVRPVHDEIYIVQEGDTLDGIAFRYNLDLDALIAANELADPSYLSIGQRLTIPTKGSSVVARDAPQDSNRPSMMAPSDAAISTYFGERGMYWRGGWHMGVDFAASQGDPVRATLGGVVIQSEEDDPRGYGQCIKIDHGNGLHTLYAHLSSRLVQVADIVESGQQIGLVGETGVAVGPHLHFEVRENGEYRDPLMYLR